MDDKANQWIEKIDPNSGRVYWGNVVTKSTTWVEPLEVKEWRENTLQESYWECYDPKSKRSYYLNQTTGKSTWLKPIGKIQRRHAESVFRKGEKQGITDQSLPKGWVACSDPRSKKTYYYNRETGETTWSRPGLKLDRGKHNNSKGKTSKKVSPHSLKKDVWKSAIDPKTQRIYYINVHTKETRWSIPLEREKAEQKKGTLSAPAIGDTIETKATDQNETDTLQSKQQKKHRNTLARNVIGSIRGVLHQTGPATTIAKNQALVPRSTLESDPEASPPTPVKGRTVVCLPDGVVTGPMMKMSHRVAKGFQPRFCVLKNDYLLYYKTEAKFQKGGAANGHVDLKRASSVSLEPEASPGEMYVIEITTKDRVWKFGVDSVQDMHIWLQTLQLSAKNVQASLASSGIVQGPAEADESTSDDEPIEKTAPNDGKVTSLYGVVSSGSAKEIVQAFQSNRARFHSGASDDDGEANRGKADAHALAPISHQVSRIHSKEYWKATFPNASGISNAMKLGRYSGADKVLLEHLQRLGLQGAIDESLLKKNTPEAFSMWLQSERIMHLEDSFKSAGYDDLVLLVQLTDADLHEMLRQEMKLAKPGHRMRVIVAVRHLRESLLQNQPQG